MRLFELQSVRTVGEFSAAEKPPTPLPTSSGAGMGGGGGGGGPNKPEKGARAPRPPGGPVTPGVMVGAGCNCIVPPLAARERLTALFSASVAALAPPPPLGSTDSMLILSSGFLNRHGGMTTFGPIPTMAATDLATTPGS